MLLFSTVRSFGPTYLMAFSPKLLESQERSASTILSCGIARSRRRTHNLNYVTLEGSFSLLGPSKIFSWKSWVWSCSLKNRATFRRILKISFHLSTVTLHTYGSVETATKAPCRGQRLEAYRAGKVQRRRQSPTPVSTEKGRGWNGPCGAKDPHRRKDIHYRDWTPAPPRDAGSHPTP